MAGLLNNAYQLLWFNLEFIVVDPANKTLRAPRFIIGKAYLRLIIELKAVFRETLFYLLLENNLMLRAFNRGTLTDMVLLLG